MRTLVANSNSIMAISHMHLQSWYSDMFHIQMLINAITWAQPMLYGEEVKNQMHMICYLQ